jgi:hypothetical protein
MHPLFNQQLANQHMEDLQLEAKLAHAAILTHRPGEVHHRLYPLSFLRYWYNWARTLYKRPALLPGHEEVRLEEIKPAVLTTFSVMHEVGLISEYDDQFIEKFVETLERELVHQSQCNSV